VLVTQRLLQHIFKKKFHLFVKGIVLAVYLMSWALVSFVIASRFLLNFHSFLLEAIKASNLGSLFFQTHLRLA
jgi:hypothetical protein